MKTLSLSSESRAMAPNNRNAKKRRKESSQKAVPKKQKKDESVVDMLRPIQDGGEDGSSVEETENPQGAEKSDSVNEVIQMMKAPQTRNVGLKKFSAMCHDDDEDTRAAMAVYLRTSPECKEFFQLLEGEERPGTHETKLIWNAFEGILLVTASSGCSNLEAIGLYVVSKILNKHVKMLYSGLNPSGPADLIKSVLKLLTVILTQGTKCVSEILSTFDFTLKALMLLPKKRDNKGQADVRTCFLRFYIAFFIFGDLNAIKAVLELQVFTNGVVNGILKDTPQMIHLILSTLNEKVLKEKSLLKKTKLAFFNKHTLTQLAHLFAQIQNKGDNEKTELHGEVNDLILEMFEVLCTDATFGILFPNKQGIFAGRSNNPVLLSFLRSIQKLAVTEPKLRDLMSKTFAAAPDLIVPVFSKLGINLEPRDSEPWRNNMSFLTELWSNIPPMASLLEETEQEVTTKNLTQVINVIFPNSLNKIHLTNGLKQQNLIVKQKTTDLILICLERALSMLKWIAHSKQNNGERNPIDRKFAADQFCELTLKQLPDIRAFITVRDKNKKDVPSSGADEKPEDVDMNQTNGSSAAGTDSEKIALENCLVEVLVHFQHLRPGIMTSADFNICKLFKIDDCEDVYDSKMLMNALRIALMEPEGNLKWLSKKSELYSNAVNLVFNAYTKSSLPDIKEFSHHLIIRLIDEAGSITENLDEVESWLEAMSQAKDPSLAMLFKDMCIMAVQESYSILDELIEVTTLCPDEDDEVEASSLETTGRSELSPLTIAAFRCSVKRMKSEKDHQCLTSLSQFIVIFLTDSLMLLGNPLALFRIIQKYLPLVQESFTEDKLDCLLIWKDFESFANVWCLPKEAKATKEFNPDDPLNLDNEMNPEIFLPKLDKTEAGNFMTIVNSALSETNRERRADQKKFAGELTEGIRVNLSHNSIPRLTKYAKVSLNYMKKLMETNSWDCRIFLALLENLISISKESMEVKDNTTTWPSCQIVYNGRKEMSFNSENHTDIVRIVLESPVLKEAFLEFGYWMIQGDLRDLINVVIKNSNHDWLIRDIAFYVNKISERLESILEDLDDRSKDEVDDWSCLLITNLEMLSPFMSTESKESLTINLVELLLKDKNELVACYDCFLKDLDNIMLTLISLLLRPPIKQSDPGNFSNSKNANKEVDSKKTVQDVKDPTDKQMPEISPLQQIALNPKSIEGLFNLSEINDSQQLSEVILTMLKMHPSMAMLAPVSLIDVYLKRRTQASLQFVELLVQGSPVHALTLRNKFHSGLDGLPISAVVQLVYSLLMAESGESRKETINAVKFSYYSTFMSVLTDANYCSECPEEEYKMLSQILMVIAKDTDLPLLSDPNIKSLHKSLKEISYSRNTAVKLRYQIELFYNCVERELISMKKSTILLESLAYLMKVWEHFIASKDQEGHEQLESTLHIVILRLSEVLCARKKTNPSEELLASLAANWSSLVRICLKHDIENNESMDVLASLVTSLYSIKKFRKNSSLTLETIYQYLLSHSRFLPILLEEDYDKDTKEALIGLLLAIAQQEPKVCKASHIKAFMTAYNATLSSTDQEILLLLRIYEVNGASILAMKPLTWGKKALEHRKETQRSHPTLYSQTSMKDVIESLDRNLLVKSAFNFPLEINVTENADAKQLKPIRDDIYDPSFLLPLFSHFLAPDFEVDCRKFIDIGCLAFVIAALSSQHIATRETAYHVLARFMNQLEGSRFLEKTQIVVLLESLKNSVIEEGMVIPSIICSFTLRCLQILLRPDQHLYEVVNHFLLHKPCLDVKDVPLFLSMLNSSSLQFNAERGWILKLLASGPRTSADYYIYKRRHVFEQIMALYHSPMCDATAKKSISEVIIAASQIHNAAFDLVKTHGLISWLQNKLTSEENDHQIDFVLQTLNNFVKTFSKGFDVVGGDGKKETKKPIPLNFAPECSSVCLVIVEKYRDVLKLEQLEMLTECLEWCISTDITSKTLTAGAGIPNTNSEQFLDVVTEQAPTLQKSTIFIPQRHIRQLIEAADSHLRQQTVLDHSLDIFYENTARITLRWMERQSLLMKHRASGMPPFIIWICCEYMKHIANNQLGLRIFEVVTAILSRAKAMLCQDDWIHLLAAHKQLLEHLIQSSLQLCCRLHYQFPATDEFFVYSFLSKSYGELRSAALLLLNSVFSCVYLHGSKLKPSHCSNTERDNLKDRDMLFGIYSTMKSKEYKGILEKIDFKAIATCEQKDDGERSIMPNESLPQSLQVLLMEILTRKDSPDQFREYCKIVGTTRRKENREE